MARVGEFFLYLWRLSRPEYWVVTLFPTYFGYLLSSRELAPGLDLWLAFWTDAFGKGASTQEFITTFATWVASGGKLILAFLVMGPLVWMATFLINDVHDLAGDRINPRKSRSPLVQGLVPPGHAHALAYLFAFLSLGVAALVNVEFFLLTLGCLALAWLYSAPPVRLKTRPGADVLVNAFGVGVLAGLAGWSLASPVSTAPFAFAPQALLVVTAVYVPTTLVDHESDRAAGFLTLATHLGRRRAYAIGMAAWILANVGALAFSMNEVYIPKRMLPVLVIFTPLLVYEYHQFIGRARTGPDLMNGIALCSLTFGAVMAVFALMYTGAWVG